MIGQFSKLHFTILCLQNLFGRQNVSRAELIIGTYLMDQFQNRETAGNTEDI